LWLVARSFLPLPQFAGALDALAGGWTIGAADAFAAAPLVIDRIGGVA